MRLLRIAVGFVLVAGCDGSTGGTSEPSPDAPGISPTSRKGGEIRLEWISRGGMTTARMGAFFYETSSPPVPFSPFPGCVDMRERNLWPLAGTTTPLDVGGVTVVPKTGTPFEMLRQMNTKDALQRLHELWWNKPEAFGVPGDADTYLPPNQSYDVILAGSAEWPHQVLQDVAFMPARWAPTSPKTAETVVLTRDQDFTVTYTPVTSSNLPLGWHVNNYITFEHPTLGPIVVCQEEDSDGAIRVPAAMVNVILDNSGPVVNDHATPLPVGATARMVRQQQVGRGFALDGNDESKGLAVLASYSYEDAWTPAP